jgi:D-tyrosyl-tRNA(Tyr) deacylase
VRAVVQRVRSASVSVAGERIAEIGPGMLVLLGVARGDGSAEAERIARKLRALRIFEDADGRMNEPLGEREVLCVSQFTLLGDVSRGNRPSFVAAAPPDEAEPLYSRVSELLGARRGRFGAQMAVELVNDGPVTLVVDA